LWCFVLFGLV